MEMNSHVASNDEPMPTPVGRRRKKKQRKNECIGGGHFVFKRNKISGRIHPNNYAFEHPNHASALNEAERLHKEDGGRYDVVSVANCIGEPGEVHHD